MTKKTLITGASGFIGMHLSRTLRKRGEEVYTLSRKGEGAQHFHLDILDFDNYGEYDFIYHLAAVTNPHECENNPEEAWSTNVDGTRHIVNQLSLGQHLIYASTPHVYSPRSKGDLLEDTVLGPSGVYGLTKMVGEELIRVFSRRQGFSYTTFRIFHAYGPGQKQGQIVPDVIRKIATQDRTAIIGPSNSISPVYIDDVIDAFTNPLLPPNTYNVCGEEVSIEKIYSLIGAFLGKSDFLSEPSEKKRMCGNRDKISKYKKNWTSIEEGLSQTVAASDFKKI